MCFLPHGGVSVCFGGFPRVFPRLFLQGQLVQKKRKYVDANSLVAHWIKEPTGLGLVMGPGIICKMTPIRPLCWSIDSSLRYVGPLSDWPSTFSQQNVNCRLQQETHSMKTLLKWVGCFSVMPANWQINKHNLFYFSCQANDSTVNLDGCFSVGF